MCYLSPVWHSRDRLLAVGAMRRKGMHGLRPYQLLRRLPACDAPDIPLKPLWRMSLCRA
jgi:hypothetical protein